MQILTARISEYEEYYKYNLCKDLEELKERNRCLKRINKNDHFYDNSIELAKGCMSNCRNNIRYYKVYKSAMSRRLDDIQKKIESL